MERSGWLGVEAGAGESVCCRPKEMMKGGLALCGRQGLLVRCWRIAVSEREGLSSVR